MSVMLCLNLANAERLAERWSISPNNVTCLQLAIGVIRSALWPACAIWRASLLGLTEGVKGNKHHQSIITMRMIAFCIVLSYSNTRPHYTKIYILLDVLCKWIRALWSLLKHVMVSKCEILCLFLCYIKTNIRHPGLLISINRFHRCLAENSRISLFVEKRNRTVLKPFQVTTKFGKHRVTLYW